MAWPNFKLAEFDCKCCGANQIDHKLIDLLQQARNVLGVPLVIASGYRCPDHNAEVSSTGRTGPHTTGKAVDVRIFGKEALGLIQFAMMTGEFTGLGVNQKGSHLQRFVHLDMLEPAKGKRPTVWSY